MSGAIFPIYRWLVLDPITGEPAAGAKAYFYASGTSTPQDTYNNADLAMGHENTNPVVAGSDGVFPIIYFSAASYRVLVTDSTGTTIFAAQDNVYDLFQIWQATTQTANTVYAGPASGAPATPTFRALVSADLPSTGINPIFNIGICEGRLSLASATPVTNTDVTAATTIYWVPYQGNRIALYDASGVPTIIDATQVSIAVPASTSQMYDVFGYISGGVLTLELTAWTNDTTRATAIVANVASGVYTKSGDATRRYLGSARTTAVSGQTEDSLAKRLLWNYWNRVPRPVQRIETTASWSYTTDTYQQANASAANQIAIVVGVSEDPIDLRLWVQAKNSAGSVSASVAIGADSVTAAASHQVGCSVNLATAGQPYQVMANYTAYSAVGYHYLAWLEKSSASGTTTWQSAAGQYAEQSGIVGNWRA